MLKTSVKTATTSKWARSALACIAAIVFALALAVSLFAPARAALAAGEPQSGAYVFDERGLFSPDQFATLEAQGAELAQTYNMGVYFLSTDYMDGLTDPSSSQRTDYAVNYYKQHHLGLNADSTGYGDGIMFVVAADSRDYVTIAYGQGSYSFSDTGIEVMEDAVTDELGNNNWYGAAQAYYREIGRQLGYYESHGKAEVPLDMFDWFVRIAIVLLAPLFITFTIINGWRREMLTAVEKSEAGNYLDARSVNVTRARDTFIRTTLVATPRPKDNDSGGGGWGGGGGGGFSSSGGGKF